MRSPLPVSSIAQDETTPARFAPRPRGAQAGSRNDDLARFAPRPRGAQAGSRNDDLARFAPRPRGAQAGSRNDDLARFAPRPRGAQAGSRNDDLARFAPRPRGAQAGSRNDDLARFAPRPRGAQAGSLRSGRALAGQGMNRIALVEDHDRLAALVCKALSAAGIAVDVFDRIEPARHAIALTPYAALVVDRGLPDGDGLSLVRRLRAAGNVTP